MKPRPTKDELRREAEERLKRKGSTPGKGRSEVEKARLVYELEVHQIELEMQNEELRRAHSDLDSQLAQYSDLYDFAPTGYVTLGRDGAIRQSNLEASRLLGVERSRLEGRRLRDLMIASDQLTFAEFLPRAFASQVPKRCEVAFDRAGREPLFVRIEFLASEDGRTGRAVLFDLTEQRRLQEQARAAAVEAEKLASSERSRLALLSAAEDQLATSAALAASEAALRESEAEIRALIEHAPTAIYEVSFDGTRFLSVNEGTSRISGYTREELMALHPMEMTDEAGSASFANRVARKLAGEAVEESTELRMRTKSGEWRDLLLNVAGFTDKDGKPERVVVIAHDITERKQAERKLREMMLELQRSNEDLEQYAYVASHDLQEPLRMVANYVELLRQRYKGQIDDKADKYIHYAVDGAVRMQGLIHDLLTYSRVGRRDGAIGPVSLGRVVQKAAENLTAAIGLSDARIDSGPLPVVLGDEVQLVQLFQNLIDNAIKFRGKELPVIRIDAAGSKDTETRGRGDTARDMTQMSDIWDRVPSPIRATPRHQESPGSEHSITRSLDPSIPSQSAESAKSADVRSEHSISRSLDHFVTIRVTDNGIGIDPKHQDRIFRLFQRLHTHEEYPGTGIGLAVCKKIVERHGGTIRIESELGKVELSFSRFPYMSNRSYRSYSAPQKTGSVPIY